MLTVIDNQERIEDLYQEFHQVLIKLFPRYRPNFYIGHQGGAVNSAVYSTPKGDFWHCAAAINWNPFGLGDSNSMIVQINFADADATRKSVGVFAEDTDGQLVVLHRGNIGGGRKGIGKTLLMNNASSPREVVLDGDKEVEMLVVGQLHSPLFSAQLRQFVTEVQRVKQLPDQAGLGGLAASLFRVEQGVFKSETAGYGSLPLVKRRASYRTHGLVVEALRQQLQQHFTNSAWQIFNDRHRDLVLTHGEKVVALFELKTVANTQDVATALGQLLLYGAAVAAPLRRIMVLPEPLTTAAVKYLAQWGIECIYFSGPADTPVFAKLPALLKSFR
ncbi:hypothetical protein GCM10027422_48110 [Hymenobacter arcticus]